MNDVREILNKYNIKPLSYKKDKSTTIVSSIDNKYVLKKSNNVKQYKDIYNYLKLRNYDFIPEIYNISDNDNIEIQEYIDNKGLPKYDKALEIINLTSLLHNKTTTYEEIDIDDYKKIYEDLDLKINDTVLYYNELNNFIDNEIYMSPSNYLLARNISKIYAALDFCKNELDVWYSLIKKNIKQRKVIINNNLELDHLIRNDNNSFLISWDKSKYDIPVYDIYHFYKKAYDEVSFDELFSIYENRYPLHEEEKKLLFIMISIPEKIEYSNDEYQNTKKVNNLINYILTTEKIISKYYSNNEKEKDYDLTE